MERLAALVPEAHEEPAEIGNYTGLALIGRGGMGSVYRALDARLNRAVALKMLSPALAGDPDARVRFQREARAAASLSHPNILPIHAIETIAGRDILVMPLNDGENLHTLIRREGPLPLDEVVRLGAAIADGLAAAHAAGIVHRDIKPPNVLLSADRREVRIADFGLAQIAGDAAQTHSSTFAGTPHFLSPEQATGQPADARSDIFSLGATLYFLATGQLPFPGKQTASVLHAVAHEPHRPTPHRPTPRSVPAWLSALLDAMMAKNPARRPASAAEVADALRRRSPRWSRRRRPLPWLRRLRRRPFRRRLVAESTSRRGRRGNGPRRGRRSHGQRRSIQCMPFYRLEEVSGITPPNHPCPSVPSVVNALLYPRGSASRSGLEWCGIPRAERVRTIGECAIQARG